MKVRELLSSEDKWTKGVSARNAVGEAVYFTNEDAVSWCLTGAVEYCYREPGAYGKVIRQLMLETGSPSVFGWNDKPSRTFQDVKEIVERLDI